MDHFELEASESEEVRAAEQAQEEQRCAVFNATGRRVQEMSLREWRAAIVNLYNIKERVRAEALVRDMQRSMRALETRAHFMFLPWD